MHPLSETARAIWQAGVAAVDSQRLVEQTIQRTGETLRIGSQTFATANIRRILVVGGGKAGAGMAAGVEAALGPELVHSRVDGWVNVPADCVRPLQKIRLHAARPASLNEPSEDGVHGTEHILQAVTQLTDDDLCLILISGGGSALLPAPLPGISLADKLTVTRTLAQAGATIQELNAVRTRLSRIKGGGLLRAIPAGRVIVLIISDVIHDPLEVIASGPTIIGPAGIDPAAVLEKYCSRPGDLPLRIRHAVESPGPLWSTQPAVTATHLIIGNNRTALDAAAAAARQRGWAVVDQGTNHAGVARETGVALAEECRQLALSGRRRVCLLSGGEPVVRLVPTNMPRRGGRNQELVLAAAVRLWDEAMDRISILSGGTDGEDGPTDAAGAWFDADVRQRARELGLHPQEFLAINNSYPFFSQTNGLLQTGPTHTNVMDVRVALIGD